MSTETPSAGEARFFIDHGMIHDRETGRHVFGDRPDPIGEALELLNSMHSAYAALKAQLERAESELEKLWPFIEAIAKNRMPFTTSDLVEATTMWREKERNER